MNDLRHRQITCVSLTAFQSTPLAPHPLDPPFLLPHYLQAGAGSCGAGPGRAPSLSLSLSIPLPLSLSLGVRRF